MLVNTVLILYSMCVPNILTNILRTSKPWKTHQAWPLNTAFASCLHWPGPSKTDLFCCADDYHISSRLWKLVWGRYRNLARFCRFLTFQELIQDFVVITSPHHCRQGRCSRDLCKLCRQIDCSSFNPDKHESKVSVHGFAGDAVEPSSTSGWGDGVLAQHGGRWLHVGAVAVLQGRDALHRDIQKPSWGWPETSSRWECEQQPGGEGRGLSWGGKSWRTPNWALAQSAEWKTGSVRANCSCICEEKIPCEGGVQVPWGCSILSSEPPASSRILGRMILKALLSLTYCVSWSIFVHLKFSPGGSTWKEVACYS